ncbi:MAG: RagB/SusD family nutrient uptake outer membrane protein [Flavobacteriaceae bacterium]|nr:RagB/SusD family nutrient uptake outer membrane protein [Flavobacteriaceae bacterium]
MKIVNNIILIRLVLIGCCFFFACDEDFLKDELLSDTSVDFLYSSADGLANAVVGLYVLQRQPYEQSTFQNASWNGMIPLVLTAKSDIAVGIDGEISLYSRLTWGSTRGDFGVTAAYDFFWSLNYKIIDRANSIIKGGEELIDGGNTDVKIIQALAEAKVMRAQAYFTLYRMFNNIYIKTEPTTPESAFDRPQDKSNPQEIFALIREDLGFASQNLSYETLQFGRWTKGAVDHLRAKVEMWDNQYQKAADIIDELISSSPHDLVSLEEVFDGELDHQETLLAINFEKSAIGGGAPHIMNWSTVSYYAGAPGLVQSIENGGNGVGFISLNDYTIDLLLEDPNDRRKDNIYYIFEYKYNDPQTLPRNKKIGDPLDLYTNHPTDPNQFFLYYRRQNPGILKFFDPGVDPTDRDHYKNVMIYRLAESYLIGAEAHNQLGNKSKALEYLNAVRQRAGADPLNRVDIDIILEERARELAFEGQRWYTIKRTGKMYDYMMDHMNNDNINRYYYPDGNPKELYRQHMEHLPIPQGQLDLLGDNYPQNDGY